MSYVMSPLNSDLFLSGIRTSIEGTRDRQRRHPRLVTETVTFSVATPGRGPAKSLSTTTVRRRRDLAIRAAHAAAVHDRAIPAVHRCSRAVVVATRAHVPKRLRQSRAAKSIFRRKSATPACLPS
jgi:hypothetical protein